MKVPQPREEFQFEWLVLIPTRQRFEFTQDRCDRPSLSRADHGRCQIVSALLIGRFNSHRLDHICKVPPLNGDRSQARTLFGSPKIRTTCDRR